MHLVIVVANSYDEFRNLVLRDTLSFGPGAVTFIRAADRMVRFRSLEDPEYSVCYMWAANYQEVKDALGQDHFRIIGNTYVEPNEPKKAEVPYGTIAASVMVIALGIILFVWR